MKRKIFNIIITLILLFNTKNILASENSIKHPNVNGMFYPSNKKDLSKMIDNFLAKTKVNIPEGEIMGIVAPHAGYIYSGAVAAVAYKTIYLKNYKNIIILAPSHYLKDNQASIYKEGYFKTPLGLIKINSDIANKLLKSSTFKNSKIAFEKEHSLEVHLPFLQKSLKDFTLVPIIISNDSFSHYKNIANEIAKLFIEYDDILVIASTDLSHFYNKNKANTIDKRTLNFIKKNQIDLLFENIKNGNCELCGSGPVITLMLTMNKIEATEIDVLSYATSADTTNSSKDKVVGYSSIVFSKPKINLEKGDTKMLNKDQRKLLLNLARKSITDYLENGKLQNPATTDISLKEKCGAFVTLKKNGLLRGCIGRIVSDKPLVNVVSDMAIAAATEDPRFPRVLKNEVDSLEIEISVMSPLKKIDDINEIEVGKHGIIIKKGFSSGLLLPQVATEYNWGRIEFLQQTCLKAGLAPNAWEKGAEILIFSAEVFNENDGI